MDTIINTASSASGATTTLFLGRDGDFWDFWLIISVLMAFVAAGGVGVATIGSIVSHKREALNAENELSIYKTDTEGKIAEANAQALTAKADLAKYKAPRAITNEMAADFVKEFSKFKGQRISFGSSPSTFESAFFVDQLVVLSNEAGMKANKNDGAVEVQIGLIKGIVARYVSDNEDGSKLAHAIAAWLKKYGIEASALNGMMDDTIPIMKQQGRFKKENEAWKWVVVGVGDKT